MVANHNKERVGFTLVELLVVISIIALLLSILMPALQAARQQSRKIGCLSNMRQIGLGIELYMAAASDGKYPQQRRPFGSWYPHERADHWWITVRPYFAGDRDSHRTINQSAEQTVGYCPNHTDYKNFNYNPGRGKDKPTSYDGSWHIINQAGAGKWRPAVPAISASDVKSPADKVLVYEFHEPYSPYLTIPYVGDFAQGWLKLDWEGGLASRAFHNQTHGRVSNFLFCDGHVGSVHGDTLMDIESHWYPRGVEQTY